MLFLMWPVAHKYKALISTEVFIAADCALAIIAIAVCSIKKKTPTIRKG